MAERTKVQDIEGLLDTAAMAPAYNWREKIDIVDQALGEVELSMHEQHRLIKRRNEIFTLREGEEEMYQQMAPDIHVILTNYWEGNMGQMHLGLWSGTEGKIILGHEDNKDLIPAHRLWLVEFWRAGNGEEGYTYHLWFRSNKLALMA